MLDVEGVVVLKCGISCINVADGAVGFVEEWAEEGSIVRVCDCGTWIECT